MANLLPRYYQDKIKTAKRLRNVIVENDGEVQVTAGAAGGDRRQLRGIPVLGAAPGTMMGTQPEDVCRRG